MRSSTRGRSGMALAVAAAAALLAAVPAAADWLVTLGEGGATSRVETRGPWEVKGRLVLFHTTEGQLASLRLDQVDLEASREATRQAEQAAQQPAAPAAEAPPPRPPRRRITDADIGPGTPPPPEEPTDGEQADAAVEDGAAAAGARAQALVVISSDTADTFDGHVRVTGTLANHGEVPAVAVGLTVHLHDVEGAPLASVAAELSSSALTPGDVTSFVADFPDVFTFGAMQFEPRGTRLATSTPESAPDSAPEPGPEDDGGGS